MNRKLFFQPAQKQALLATCHRARCGAVVVSKTGDVIGAGFNAPPLGDEDCRYCEANFDFSIKPKYDKTCCVHAEWNAIIDALKKHGKKIDGGTLYFMRVDDAGNFTDAGEPFCTVCSRLAMSSGLAKFALWVNNQPKIYDVKDYNIDTYNMYMKTQRQNG
jgi:tRNA(Arg) A34 adenosine deaminase TadA